MIVNGHPVISMKVSGGAHQRTTFHSRFSQLRSWFSTPLHIVLAICSLLLIVPVIVFIVQNGRNVPYGDEWVNSVQMALKTVEGRLTLADIVRQNFDHRVAISNLFIVFLTLTTHWNLHVSFFIIVGISFVNLLLLLALLRRSDARAVTLALVLFSALVFSLRQTDLWIWSILAATPILLFCLLAILLWLNHSPVRWRTIIGVAVMVALMTFSAIQGMALWLLLLLMLWAKGYRRAHLLFWIGGALFTLILFSLGYDFSLLGANENGNSAGLALNPGRLIGYVLTYLGSPFVAERAESIGIAALVGIFGVVMMTVNVIYLWRLRISAENLTIWLTLAAFGVSAALLSGLGRAHVFPEPVPTQPLLSRYVIYANTFWFAFVALAALAARSPITKQTAQSGKRMLRANIVVAAVLIPLHGLANIQSFLRPANISTEIAECMQTFPTSRNVFCPRQTYIIGISLEDVLDSIDRMAVHRLALFADQPPPFTELIEVRNSDQEIIEQGPETISYQYYQFNPQYETVVLRQYAPSRLEHRLTLPATEQTITLVSGVFIGSADSDATEDGADGARFQLFARTNDDTVLLFDTVVMPSVVADPLPFSVDLSAYAGQTISLVFVTDERENTIGDRTRWLDPIITAAADTSADD
ncbi:MAG: hypothetical protein H7175_24555 [Burkholderiales bacterium]|nr:hypothetical protein [Anaerolineae bacterium]